MSLPRIAALSAAAVAAVLTFAALADDAPVFQVDPAIAGMTADQKVAAREAAMKQDGMLLKSIAQAAAPDPVKAIDTVLQNFTNFPVLFADGATNAKSAADPAIWKEFDKFTALLDRGKAALLTMRAAAASGDAAGLKAGLGQLGSVCSDCHKAYRDG